MRKERGFKPLLHILGSGCPELGRPRSDSQGRAGFALPRRSALLLHQLLAFGDFLKLRVELWQLGGVQAELGTEGAKWGD
jgi:hypothetical protein